MCNVLAACLYWNGLPTNWSMSDLWDIDKFPSSTKREKVKEWARRHRVLDMTFEIVKKIRKGQIKGTFHDENNGPYFVSPQEFFKYAYSRGYDPHDLEKMRQDLCFAPPNIQSAIYEMKKREIPALASAILDLKKRKLPKCACGGKIACCVHNVLGSASLSLHRKQVKECAKKINIDCMATRGRKATPQEIYTSRSFQSCLKRLRDPKDPETTIQYPKSIIMKNWIPQAIGKRGTRGRPRIKKRKQTNAKTPLET